MTTVDNDNNRWSIDDHVVKFSPLAQMNWDHLQIFRHLENSFTTNVWNLLPTVAAPKDTSLRRNKLCSHLLPSLPVAHISSFWFWWRTSITSLNSFIDKTLALPIVDQAKDNFFCLDKSKACFVSQINATRHFFPKLPNPTILLPNVFLARLKLSTQPV